MNNPNCQQCQKIIEDMAVEESKDIAAPIDGPISWGFHTGRYSACVKILETISGQPRCIVIKSISERAKRC